MPGTLDDRWWTRRPVPSASAKQRGRIHTLTANDMRHRRASMLGSTPCYYGMFSTILSCSQSDIVNQSICGAVEVDGRQHPRRALQWKATWELLLQQRFGSRHPPLLSIEVVFPLLHGPLIHTRNVRGPSFSPPSSTPCPLSVTGIGWEGVVIKHAVNRIPHAFTLFGCLRESVGTWIRKNPMVVEQVVF
jgi:hypothetical protein